MITTSNFSICVFCHSERSEEYLITVLGTLAKGNDQRCLASLNMTRGSQVTAVILSEAKNLRSSLPAPTDGHRTSVVVPSHHLNRATMGSFVLQARFSCCGASPSASSRIRSRRSRCESVRSKLGGSNDSVS